MGDVTEVAHASVNVLHQNDLRRFVDGGKIARWCHPVVFQISMES